MEQANSYIPAELIIVDESINAQNDPWHKDSTASERSERGPTEAASRAQRGDSGDPKGQRPFDEKVIFVHRGQFSPARSHSGGRSVSGYGTTTSQE